MTQELIKLFNGDKAALVAALNAELVRRLVLKSYWGSVMEIIHGHFTFKVTKKMWPGEEAALQAEFDSAPSFVAKETLLLHWTFSGIGELVLNGVPLKVLRWADQLDNIMVRLGKQRDTKTYRSAKDYLKLALEGTDGRGYNEL